MAIITIAKIQVRRGKKHEGAGIPQLSSGELGWAIDARELYIGNGTASEGAPEVGNTRVLTEFDSLFDLPNQYTYKPSQGLQTGPSLSSPTQRSMQGRLDDVLYAESFGAVADGVTDNTSALQRALFELYVHNADARHRATIYLSPGEYLISDTLRIPPYTRLIGSGIGKTVIKQSSPGVSVFATVGDDGSDLVVNDTYETQCRGISISDITLLGSVASPVLTLQNCRDSDFHFVEFKGNRSDSLAVSASEYGVELRGVDSTVFSQNNKFSNCEFTSLSYGVISNSCTRYNVFSNCDFDGLGYGVVYGNTLIAGVANYPELNRVESSRFINIDKNGILVNVGKQNSSMSNTFINVGNDRTDETTPVEPIVVYNEQNQSSMDVFERTQHHLIDTGEMSGVSYPSEIFAPIVYGTAISHNIQLPISGNPTGFLRLPFDNNQSYVMQYSLSGVTYSGSAVGILSIVGNGTSVVLDDNRTYNGDAKANTVVSFVGTVDDVNNVIYINVSSIGAGDETNITFTLKNYSTTL